MITSRQCFLLIATICLGLILTALYMQHMMGLNPCYLCIVQRFFVIATGILALIAFFHNSSTLGIRVYGAVIAGLALAGSGFSIRQLWLQSLPEDQIPACGPPADYLLDSFSFAEVLPILLKGDGNCAEVQWTFLTLSIPAWTLVVFLLLSIVSIWQLARPRKGH